MIDYFPEDFLLVIDESHVTVPQIGAMYQEIVQEKSLWLNTASGYHLLLITGR